MARVSFKQQMQRVREEAIVASASRRLAEKGFDAMTVDEVAADVGIAKASLYKHFRSKEALAAEAMARVLVRTQELISALEADAAAAPLARLKSVARWAMTTQLAGEMPSLPTQNSTLRAALMAHPDYMNRLLDVSERLGGWIAEAQAAGDLNPALPAEVVLYTLFARACDPVLMLLKAGGQYGDDQIIDWLLTTCFGGLGRPAG